MALNLDREFLTLLRECGVTHLEHGVGRDRVVLDITPIDRVIVGGVPIEVTASPIEPAAPDAEEPAEETPEAFLARQYQQPDGIPAPAAKS